MTAFPKTLIAAASLLAMTAGSSLAETYIPTADLLGTIWVADGPQSWTSLDRFGNATVGHADRLYVKFRDHVEGIPVICIHWWNEAEGVSVVEHSLMLPEGENAYAYTEANPPEDSGFPGIHGGGTFTLLGDGRAALTKIGHLLDGSAGAFSTELELVAEEPQTPITPTYPAM